MLIWLETHDRMVGAILVQTRVLLRAWVEDALSFIMLVKIHLRAHLHVSRFRQFKSLVILLDQCTVVQPVVQHNYVLHLVGYVFNSIQLIECAKAHLDPCIITNITDIIQRLRVINWDNDHPQ